MERVLRRIRCKGITETLYAREPGSPSLGLYFEPTEFEHALRIAGGFKDCDSREDFWEGIFASKRTQPGYTVYQNFPLTHVQAPRVVRAVEELPSMPPEYVSQKTREILEMLRSRPRQNAG